MQHKRKFSDKSLDGHEIPPQDFSRSKVSEKQEGQFSKILENMKRTQDLREEDESFFIKLFKKNMEHFKNGGEFADLIDFGKSVTEWEETSPRKFSLMQQHDLENTTK